MMIRVEREDKGHKGRWVIYDNEVFAGEMTFTWAGNNKFIIDHTAVDEKFGGKGYGLQLVMKAVEFARAEKLQIIPLCPFAKKVFDKDKSLDDVKF